jgi:hypothetical protein
MTIRINESGKQEHRKQGKMSECAEVSKTGVNPPKICEPHPNIAVFLIDLYV